MPKIHLNYADDPLEYYADQRRSERRTPHSGLGEDWRSGNLLQADRRVAGRRRNDPKSLAKR